MSPVAHDFLPPEITEGELAAIRSASDEGIITPPLYNCLRAARPRAWATVHLRYLERRGLVAGWRCRLDGQRAIRLNAAGMALR